VQSHFVKQHEIQQHFIEQVHTFIQHCLNGIQQKLLATKRLIKKTSLGLPGQEQVQSENPDNSQGPGNSQVVCRPHEPKRFC